MGRILLGNIMGPAGETGANGKSAYEIAVENGSFTGTEDQWLESLNGEDGKDGIASIDDLIDKLSLGIDENGYLYVDIGDDKTAYTLTVNSAQLESASYTVEEISQDNYNALKEKVSDTLYLVQPNVAQSGTVYFLGDTAVDTAVKNGKVVYTRNLLKATSEKITAQGGGSGNYLVTPYYFYPGTLIGLGLQADEYIACSWSWKAYGEELSGYINPVCSGTPNYLRTGTKNQVTTGIYPEGVPVDRCTISESFTESDCTFVAQIDGSVTTNWTNGNATRMGLYLGDTPNTMTAEMEYLKFSRSDTITEWTVAPEDIIT